MENHEKTLSLYFDAVEGKTTEAGFYPHANRAGIIASLAIHAIFLLFFVFQPTARMAAVKTFTISFTEGGASVLTSPAPPATGAKMETAAIAPPMKKQVSPAQPRKAIAKPEPVAVAPVALSQPVVETPPAVDQKREEAALPPVSQNARGDEFIASTVSLPANGASTSEHISSDGNEAAGAIVSAAGGDGKNGMGIRAGNGSGSGQGAPLHTSFGAMNAPSFIHRAMPVYPPLARRRGKEGRVVLTLLIDQNGMLQKIDITEPAGYGLTEAAIEAVKNSTFAPARVNGQKAASRAILPIRFKLE